MDVARRLARTAKSLVFDILGHLYEAPVVGGRARALSAGLPFDTQATFSRDGRRLAFVSDRSGADNVWVMDADGGHPRPLSTSDDDAPFISPAWSPDGDAVFVSRFRADLQSYELWRYPVAGGDGRLIVPARDSPTAPRDQWRSTLGAVVSPDGRYLYAARHVGPTTLDNLDEWTIIRRDLATGEEITVVSRPEGPRKALDPGAAFRPVLSPDGRTLAYAEHVEGQTELRLRDLTTGEDQRLAIPIAHDQVQALAWQDLVPRYAFTPDGRGVVLSRDGGIERIDVASGASTSIPFVARVDQADRAPRRVPGHSRGSGPGPRPADHGTGSVAGSANAGILGARPAVAHAARKRRDAASLRGGAGSRLSAELESRRREPDLRHVERDRGRRRVARPGGRERAAGAHQRLGRLLQQPGVHAGRNECAGGPFAAAGAAGPLHGV